MNITWFFNPTKAVAQHMEIAFAIGLFLTTLLVVIGLIGEYRTGDWWKRYHHVFEMLVVIGVAGEMVTETGAFWFSERLQSIEEAEIVSAQQMANESAKEAGALGVTVDNLQNFVLQKETEAREVQNRMLAMMAPRNLSDKQIAKIGTALSKFSGQPWTVTTYWDSKEPLALANKIFTALSAAKWQYDNEGSKSLMLGGVDGVQVFVHPQAKIGTKSAADALVAALNSEGISTVLRQQNNPQNPNDKLHINVGSKPAGPF